MQLVYKDKKGTQIILSNRELRYLVEQYDIQYHATNIDYITVVSPHALLEKGIAKEIPSHGSYGVRYVAVDPRIIIAATIFYLSPTK